MHEKLVYTTESPEKRVETFSNLSEALNSKDLTTAQSLLKNPEVLRGLVIERKFDMLFDFINKAIQEKYGIEKNILAVSGKELITLIKEMQLPEQILVELSDSAYHQNNREAFFKLTGDIFENKEALSDGVYLRALHNLANWEGEKEKNPEEQKRKNIEVLIGSREIGDKVLAEKANIGLKLVKEFDLEEKAEDFTKINQKLNELGDSLDAIRAAVEASRMYLKLALKQFGAARANTLKKALEIGQEAFKSSRRMNYPVADIKARKVLSEIYSLMKNEDKADNFKRGVQKLEGLYDYTIQE